MWHREEPPLRYDVSGDGFLDISELRNAMGHMFLFNQEPALTAGLLRGAERSLCLIMS